MIPLVERYLKRIPQYTRNARHLRSVLQHGTPRKLANLAMAEAERKLRRVEVRSRPYLLIIDPCNYCNLRCPLCPTGMGELGRPQGMMSFDCFRRYFDPHAPYLFEAYLHNWGESLINPEVFRMIEYVQGRNVGTNLSSNLVVARSDDLDNLIDSGLEYLVVSLDGTDAESYRRYRRRGDYDRVVENMAELIRRRNARGRKLPVVEWQFIVMRHNEHQTEEAARMADRLGVDVMRFIPVGLPYGMRDRETAAREWFPRGIEGRTESTGSEQQFGQGSKPGPCFYLYRSMVVNADGGISPCCVVYRQSTDFGDLSADARVDVASVWNNERYRSARSLFSGEEITGRVRTTCDACDIFQRHPSKSGRDGLSAATPTPPCGARRS